MITITIMQNLGKIKIVAVTQVPHRKEKVMARRINKRHLHKVISLMGMNTKVKLWLGTSKLFVNMITMITIITISSLKSKFLMSNLIH